MAFSEAVRAHYVFNILDLSLKLSRAAKYLVSEREIAFGILGELPNPFNLGEDEQFVIAQIVDQVEQAYGGVLDKLSKKWRAELERQKSRKAA